MNATQGNVLIIDDDQSVCLLLEQILKAGGYQAAVAPTGEEGLRELKRQEYQAVLLDMHLPDGSGLDLIAKIHEHSADASVIVITGFASVETAVRAIKSGAYDYLQKPLYSDSVLMTVAKGLERTRLLSENKYLQQTLDERYGFEKIIAKSKAMLAVFDLIRKVAETSTTVLIQGESGTGKELAARALHFNSRRRHAKFVPLNCGGIPETLLESELFGYVRGAFTGAAGNKQGLFKQADQGTIFLDEIGAMPLVLQVKLLRVLQDGAFYPLGGTQPVEADVRVVAATNQDLEDLVKRSLFREDLYYRLNVIQINLPPLRERREDIMLLSSHFLKKYAAEQGKSIESFSPEAVSHLSRNDWPGNVRELENAIEHGVTLCAGSVLEPRHFPQRRLGPRACDLSLMTDRPLHQARAEFEKRYIKALLSITGGNVTRAAQMAGIARQNLQLKLREYEISSRSFSRNGVTIQPPFYTSG
ncbi:MAG: sigma-54 dependent transcriptional regulator [Candidatus Edwardsbacteria bacterium]|nr:sigma-54 dependent transcriptional regulator [Candidatus Edwardsbacteria bacterium]